MILKMINRTNYYLKDLFKFFGEDPNREGLKKTPERYFKALEEMLYGYKIEEKDIMTTFTNESKIDQIVGLSNLEFNSVCEHHLLPFIGKAHIFYIPSKKICGISKLKRILDMYSRRLQNQERITKQIADLIDKNLNPTGIAVILEANHLCMRCRGVKTKALMKTSDLRGAFRTDEKARTELFNLIRL
jgi:GTP cyclohydrolase IA